MLKFTSDFVSNGAGGSLVLTGTNFGEVAGSIPSNGNAGLKKTGPGTWTLSGPNNAYAGATSVSGGILIADAINACGTSDVTITGGQLTANATHSLSNNLVTVNGGTLAIVGDDCLGNTNTLMVAPSGTVQLDAGTKEVIGAIWLDGIEQPLGSYGSTASRAKYKDDTYFTGTGILYVGVEPPPLGTVIQLF